MATIRFRCRGCFKGLEVPESAAGSETECPHCKRALVIPRPKHLASKSMAQAGVGESTWSGSEPDTHVAVENPILKPTRRIEAPASSNDDLSLLAADLAKNARVSAYANPGRTTRYPSNQHRSGRFKQLERKKSQWPLILVGCAVVMLVAAVAILLTTRKVSFGRSFQVITDVSDSGQLTMHGYSYHQGRATGGFEVGTAFLVAVPDGVTLGGRHFATGSIVLVSNEGTSGHAYFRLATPEDKVNLQHSVTVKGSVLNAGVLRIMPGGHVAGLYLPGQSDRALVKDGAGASLRQF